MDSAARSLFTQMLNDLDSDSPGDEHLREKMNERLHAELRVIAGAMMRHERQDHTMQPTALVHEVYLKMVNQSEASWENRAHFFGSSARAMRQILVDHARRHDADKRGGGWRRVTLTENISEADSDLSLDIIALDSALDKLNDHDSRMAEIVEMRVFGGLISKEVAHVLSVSKRTVDEDWKVAKMFLARELDDSGVA